MKILWIDDFNRATTNLKRIGFVSESLGTYVNKKTREALDRLAASANHEPERLQKVLRQNPNPIYWYDGFVNGLQAIIEDTPFDFIILDADLPIDDNLLQSELNKASPKTQEAINQFRQNNVFPLSSSEAGFTLYFYLIEQGFPRDKMVFLSAHVDKAEEIKKAFVSAKATPPNIFDKTNEKDIKRFLTILNTLSKDKYVTLRRGILDVLTEIERDETIQLTPSFEDHVDKLNFINGLKILLKTAHNEPLDDEGRYFYLTLCDYLTKHFEVFSFGELRAAKRNYRKLKESDHNPVESETSQAYMIPVDYAIPILLTRNWVAHGLMNNIESQLLIPDISFIFISTMRCLFDYPRIEDENEEASRKSINDFLDHFSFLRAYSGIDDDDLAATLVKLQNHFYYRFKEFDIFERIRLRGQKSIKGWETEDFVTHIYASFLFSCVKIRETSAKENVPDKSPSSGYRVTVFYNVDSDSEKDDGLFETLKLLAYYQLRERNPSLFPK